MFGRNDNMKKQIAVLMAAATAVTTVAPVVANAANVQTDKATALAKVKEAFAVRYTDPAETGLVGKVVKDGKEYMNSVYKYAAKIDGTYRKADGTREFADVMADSYEGLSLGDIEALFNYANLHGKEVVLEKYNKGFRKFDNFISPSEYTAYQKYVVDAADANNDQTIKDMFTNMLYIKKGTDFVAPDYLASVEYNGLRYVLKSVGASKTPALVPEALAADANLSLMSMADLVGKKVVFLNKADAAAAKLEALTATNFEVFDFANVLRINLAGGAVITLNEKSSYVLNFEYAIDKDGKIHNVKARNIKDVADATTKIIDFGKVETVNGTKQAYNIATKLDSEENVFVSQASMILRTYIQQQMVTL